MVSKYLPCFVNIVVQSFFILGSKGFIYNSLIILTNSVLFSEAVYLKKKPLVPTSAGDRCAFMQTTSQCPVG